MNDNVMSDFDRRNLSWEPVTGMRVHNSCALLMSDAFMLESQFASYSMKTNIAT